MEDGSRRQNHSSHPKKQKSGVTVASASSRSHRLSPAASGKRSATFKVDVEGQTDYQDQARASHSGQKPEFSGSSATGERLQGGNDASQSEHPAKHSVATEASSMWVESSKLYSMAVQPTEGAHLNTATSSHYLVTGASLGRQSGLDEKEDEQLELMALSGPLGREKYSELQTADSSRQHQASSPEQSGGDRRHGEADRMASRYTRRWDTAPSPRRLLDDSALEVDHSQQRSSKHRADKEKRLKSVEAAKLHSKSLRELEVSQAQASANENAPHQATWMPKQSRGHDDAANNMAIGSTAIQTAAKQTGFLQRHVSAKAERNIHSIKLNEDNLNSLQPRKEQRIDPRERILAWIEQGEACLKSSTSPRNSTHDFSLSPNHAVGQPPSQPPPTPRTSGRKPSKSTTHKKKEGGMFSCCWQF